jgi:hypothetical protein
LQLQAGKKERKTKNESAAVLIFQLVRADAQKANSLYEADEAGRYDHPERGILRLI